MGSPGRPIGWFAVEVTWYPALVWVAVADCGAPYGPRVADDPAAEHGRGLVVVRGLSLSTGVTGDHRGRVVWAQIAWDDPRPAPCPPSLDACQATAPEGGATRLHARWSTAQSARTGAL